MSFFLKKAYFYILRFLVMRGLPIYRSLLKPKQYWESRSYDTNHSPDMYLSEDRSTHEGLDDLLNILDCNAGFLEIGCNAGRNLNYLYGRGYKHLAGIEINALSINDCLRTNFPELHSIGQFYIGNAATEIRKIPDSSYDVVFSMSVLTHIPPSDISLFKDMVRVSKRYVVVETSENGVGAFPYDFGKIFERYGCKLIASKLFYGNVPDDARFPVELYDDRAHFFKTSTVKVFIKCVQDSK